MSVTSDAVLGAVVTLGIPTLAFTLRGMISLTRSQERIASIARELEQRDKLNDETHREIVEQMREDRKATNERLTWLERNLWAGPRNGTQTRT